MRQLMIQLYNEIYCIPCFGIYKMYLLKNIRKVGRWSIWRILHVSSIIISCHLPSSKCKLPINHLLNQRGFCASMPRCFTKLLMLKTTHKERLQNIRNLSSSCTLLERLLNIKLCSYTVEILQNIRNLSSSCTLLERLSNRIYSFTARNIAKHQEFV